MDAGFAQLISSILGGLVSIAVAVIAGYYTVKAAQIKAIEEKAAKEKAPEEGTPQTKPVQSKRTRSNLIGYAIILSIVSMPIGFVAAYIGNLVTGVPSVYLFGDSLDPALISGLMSFVGYLLGAWINKLEVKMGNVLLLFILVSLISAPVSYSIAYIGNLLSGTSSSLLFDDSFDSLVVGTIMCSIGFVIGVSRRDISPKTASQQSVLN